jgi:hypothetical protein
MKIKTLLLLVIVYMISIGCSMDRKIWKNVYINIDPDNLEEIQVKYNRGSWETQKNGEEFHIEYKKWVDSDTGEKMYSLTYAGSVKVFAAYFTGFDNRVLNKNGDIVEDGNMELPYDYKRAYSFKSTGRLKEAEEYELSVSEYLLEE